MDGRLKNPDEKNPFMKAGGRGVCGEEVAHDILPRRTDFLFANPLVEAEFSQRLLDQRWDALRRVFREGALGDASPFLENPRLDLRIHE